MALILSLSEDTILTALRAFLLACMPDGPTVPIVQGQINRVPTPDAADFIVFWPTWRKRLATNIDTWDAASAEPTLQTLQQNTQLDVQLDLHGDRGADLAQIISTAWRDDFACRFFESLDPPVPIVPLYAEDPRQLPFINEAQQYEDRWVLTLSLQANPVVSTAQQFADTVTIDVIEIDATYPAGA